MCGKKGGVLHRSWKTIWSTPLGDLDQPIRLAEGKFFRLSPKLIEKSPAPTEYFAHPQTIGTFLVFSAEFEVLHLEKALDDNAQAYP